MPFFAAYRVEVDGRTEIRKTPGFDWTLKPGPNRLRVAPVDAFGRVGIASSVTLHYAP
jgi:hypothetical protein